ncbi:FAD-binding oxidoreductase [Sphingomonas koreensis]|nr:FAD-binding oxidoreductase [Sphingomonas koreensis]
MPSAKPNNARPRPGQAGWPDSARWKALNEDVGGRLDPVAMPKLDPGTAPKLLANPFYLGSQPALTQSSGWIDAWRSSPSAYVVRAKDAADVSAAVRFAAAQSLRLVVKGGGHSYLGGSNAPDSLLVWTRDMNTIKLHDDFVPQGSSEGTYKAVSLGAGCLWLHAYQAVTGDAGRYVQGGGCTTVGVAGLVQGGGFGSFSKKFGLAAASLLEAEIVIADGTIHVVNAVRHPDLFWALKGGGGGTFGVVTRVTLKTHDLPATFGAVLWEVQATSDQDYRDLLRQFVDCYAEHLFEPRWGEQVRATPGNRLSVQMLFHSLSADEARAAWKPFADFVIARPKSFRITKPMVVAVLPAREFWNADFIRQHMPQLVISDDRPRAVASDYWWSGNSDEAGTFWHGYQSLWLPRQLLEPDARSRLVDAWFAASRHWSVTFHFNKGLAGGSDEAIVASRDTAMNPQVLDAFALVIIANDGPSSFPGLPKPDLDAARRDALAIRTAADTMRIAAPRAGSYLSECDYFLPDWQRASWGDHAPRLARIKQHYDPEGLFYVHHGVGSEHWIANGFVRAQ